MSSLLVFFEQLAKSATILLDDVVVLAKPAISRIGDATLAAKMAAASAADDTLPLAKTAMKKASAVVVDDTAVSSDQLNEASIAQHREYAVWMKIVAGSLVNKVVLLAVILITAAIAPVIPQIMLAFGAAYLAYEGAHKVQAYGQALRNKWRVRCGQPPLCEQVAHAATTKDSGPGRALPGWLDRFLGQDPKERAVLTDLILLDAILSTEILLVAYGSLDGSSFAMRVVAMSLVALATTLGVYGIVLAIIRVDNVAAYLANPQSALSCPRVAQGMMRRLPFVLQVIGVVGTTAMLGVAGDVVHHLLPSALIGLGLEGAGHGVHAGWQSAIDTLDAFLPIGGAMLVSLIVGFAVGALMVWGQTYYRLRRRGPPERLT